jgi:desulfoferrodoxin (superoxide reductase-like protein)
MKLGILMIILVSLLPVIIIYANVPSMLNIKIEISGDSNILLIEVAHSNPTSTHFVNVVELEIGDEQLSLNLEPQTSGTFTVEVEIDSIPETLRARAKCTTHGWSQWRSFTTDSDNGGGGGIPGFPMVSIMLGFITALIAYRYALKGSFGHFR